MNKRIPHPSDIKRWMARKGYDNCCPLGYVMHRMGIDDPIPMSYHDVGLDSESFRIITQLDLLGRVDEAIKETINRVNWHQVL